MSFTNIRLELQKWELGFGIWDKSSLETGTEVPQLPNHDPQQNSKFIFLYLYPEYLRMIKPNQISGHGGTQSYRPHWEKKKKAKIALLESNFENRLSFVAITDITF